LLDWLELGEPGLLHNAAAKVVNCRTGRCSDLMPLEDSPHPPSDERESPPPSDVEPEVASSGETNREIPMEDVEDRERVPDDLPPADVDEGVAKELAPRSKAKITPPSRPARQQDDLSDAGAISDESESGSSCEEVWLYDWDNELSVGKIAVGLRSIEGEIRSLLQDRDPKRKRRLAGTRRWLELEEDLRNLHYTGRVDEPALQRLQLLVAKRHHLFRRLRFLTGTRPTWNT